MSRLPNRQKTSQAKPSSIPAPITKTLLFALEQVAGQVQYRLYSAEKTNQGWQDIHPYSKPSHLEQLPGFAKPDRSLLQALRSAQSRPGAVLEDNDLAAYLLERLLGTERLFWGHPASGVRLERGAPRMGAPTWQMLPDGAQRPMVLTEPPIQALLGLSGLWYVDTQHKHIGRLETGLPDQVAKHFAGLAPVSPEGLETLRQDLQSRFPALPLPPLPATLEVAQPCVVRLTLKTQKSTQNWLPDQHYALLEYVYDQQVIAEGERRQLMRFVGQTLEHTKRDLETERGAVLRLQALGLGKLGIAKIPNAWGYPTAGFDPWLGFLNRFAPSLRAAGWQILEDTSWGFKVAEIEDWYGQVSEDLPAPGGNNWFGLELGVVVDGQRISLLPILSSLIERIKDFGSELANLPDQHIFYANLPDGRMLALPAMRVRSVLGVLLELYSERPRGVLRLNLMDAARLLELQEALSLRWHGAERLLEFAQRLRSFAGIGAVQPPRGLQTTLRPYQLEGVAWLQFLRQYNLAGVLADDMGLGKTVQTLAHLLLEQESGRLQKPALVIMPTSLVTNWRLEAARFAPSLRLLVLHGQSRDHSAIKNADLVLTTYPIVLRDYAELRRQQFSYIILDEAQYIKNAKSSTTQIVGALNAQHRLCLTGTPLENHLGELWSIFNFLMPGFLGDDPTFKQQYRTPIERHADFERQNQLVRRLKPFLLRRKKHDVVKELPEKSEIVVPLELEGGQRDLYETIRVAVSEQVRAEVAHKGLARSQIVVLDALLKLRQACCDPRLVNLERAKSVSENAKLEWLEENLPTFLEDGRRILLFSAFATLLGNLEPSLDKLGIAYSKLTGQTKDRAQQIERFQDGETSVFLISLKAGGVGLNLTAADTVIHFDPWWNPAAEDQASSRAHRIGQTKKVFVYKLITQGSLEEKILELQKRKAELAKGILEGGLHSATALGQEDLDALLAPLG
jgi:superfamily II DNA or RNA helicase